MAQPFNSNNQMPFEARNFHGNFVNNVESVAGFTRHVLPGQIVYNNPPIGPRLRLQSPDIPLLMRSVTHIPPFMNQPRQVQPPLFTARPSILNLAKVYLARRNGNDEGRRNQEKKNSTRLESFPPSRGSPSDNLDRKNPWRANPNPGRMQRNTENNGPVGKRQERTQKEIDTQKCQEDKNINKNQVIKGPVIRRKRFRTPTAVKRAQTAVSKYSSGILSTLTDKNMDRNSETSLQGVANEKNCSTSNNIETQSGIDDNTKEDDKKLVSDCLKEKATGKGRPTSEYSSVKTESSMLITDNKNEGGTNNSNKRTNLVVENEKLPDCFKNKSEENRCREVTNNFGSDKECLTGVSGKDSIVDYTPRSKDSVIGKESLTGKRKKKDVRKTIFLQNLPEGKTSFVNNRQKNRHSKNGKKSPKNSAVDRLKHFNNSRVAAHRNPSPKYSTTSNSAENSLRDLRDVNGLQNMENGRKANAIAEEVVARNCFYRFMRIDESSSQARTSLPRGRDTKILEANRTAKRTLIKNDNSNSSDDVTKGKRALEGTSSVSSPSKRRCFDCKNTEGFDKMNPKKDMNTTFKAAGLVVSPPKNNCSDAKSSDNSDQFTSKKDISSSFKASGLVVSPPKKNNGSDRNTENSEKFDSKENIGTTFKAAGLPITPPKSNCLDFKNTENSDSFDSKKDVTTVFKATVLADAPSKNNCSGSKGTESSDKFGSKKDIGGSYKAADVLVAPLKNQHYLKSKQSPIKSNSQKNIPTTDKATDIIVAPSKSKYSADNLASKNNVGITFIPDGLLVVPPNNKFSEAKTTESADKSCSKKNSDTTFKDTTLDALPKKSKTIDTKCTENSKNLDPMKNIAFDLKVLIERCESTDSKSKKKSKDSLTLKKEVVSDAKVLKQEIKNTGAPNNIQVAPKNVDTPSHLCETDATVTATCPVVAPPKGKCQDNNDKRDPKATVGPIELRNVSVEKDTRKSDEEDGSDGMSVSQVKKGKESSMENSTGKLNNPDKGNVKDSPNQLEENGLAMTTHSVKDVVQKIGHGSNFDEVHEVSVLPKNSESTENLSMQNKPRKQEMKLSETKEMKLSVGDTTLKINNDKSGETAQLEEDAFKTTDVITNSTNNSEKKRPANTSCKQHYENKSLTGEGVLGDMLISKKFSTQKKQENDGLTVTKDGSEYDRQKMNGRTNFDVAELAVDAIDDSSFDKERVVEKRSKVDRERDDKSLQKDLCSKRPISSCTSVPLTNVPTENNNGSVMEHSCTTDIMDARKANNSNVQKIDQVRNPVKGDLKEKGSEGCSSTENGNRGLNESLPVPTIPDKISVEDDHENRKVLENEEQLATISENNSSKTNNLNREGVGNVLEIEVKPETVLDTVPMGNGQFKFKFNFTIPAEETSLNGQTNVSESKHGSLTSNGQKTTKILRNTDVATSEISPCESKSVNVNKTIVTYVENEDGELIMSEQFIHQKTNFDRKNTDNTSERLQKITSSSGTKSSTICDDEYSKKSPRSENVSAMQVSQEVKKESKLGEIFSKDYSPDFKRTVEDKNERETFSNSLSAADLPKNNTSYGHNTSSIVKIYESNISKDTQLHNDQTMAGMTRKKSNGSESSLEIRNTGSGIDDVQKVKLENMSLQRINTGSGIEQGAKVKIEKMPPPKANSEEKEKINSNSVKSTIVSDVERTQNLSKPIKCANTGRSPAFFPHFALMERNRVQEEHVRLVSSSRQDLLGISQKPVDFITETSSSIRKNHFSGSMPMYSHLYADYEHLSLPGPSHTSLQNHAQNKSQLSGVNAHYNVQENGTEKRKKARQQEGKNRRKKRLRRETQNQQAIQQKECNVQNGKGLGGNGNAQQKFKPGSLKGTAVKVNVGSKESGGSCTHSSQSSKNFLHPSSQSESNNTKGGRQRGKDLSQNGIGQIMNKTNVGTLNPSVQDPRHGSNIAVDKYFSQSLNHLSASFQESLHSASLSGNPDRTSGGTAVGIGGPNDNTDTALVGKRKRNDELAVLDENKRQKCQSLNGKSVRQSNDQLASVSNVVESISLKERKEEAERQKQENDFILKKIKQIQKKYDRESAALLKNVKMLASMDPSLTDKLGEAFKDSLTEIGRKLILKMNNVKQQTDRNRIQRNAVRQKVPQNSPKNKKGGKGVVSHSQTKSQKESTKGTTQNNPINQHNTGNALKTQQKVAEENALETNPQKKNTVASHSQKKSQNGSTEASVQNNTNNQQSEGKPKVRKRRRRRRWRKGKRKTATVGSTNEKPKIFTQVRLKPSFYQVQIKAERKPIIVKCMSACGAYNQHGTSSKAGSGHVHVKKEIKTENTSR